MSRLGCDKLVTPKRSDSFGPHARTQVQQLHIVLTLTVNLPIPISLTPTVTLTVQLHGVSQEESIEFHCEVQLGG